MSTDRPLVEPWEPIPLDNKFRRRWSDIRANVILNGHRYLPPLPAWCEMYVRWTPPGSSWERGQYARKRTVFWWRLKWVLFGMLPPDYMER